MKKEEEENIEKINNIDVSNIKYTVDNDMNIYINGELKFKATEVKKQYVKTEINYINII